jgi:hypothetical protein
MTFAVSTGLDSFSNPQDLGPLYPFEGAEWLFVVIAVLLWLGWTFLQNRGETSQEREAVEYYEHIGLGRAMFHGGSALIATDEEWAEELRRRGAGERPPPPPAA